MNLGHLAAFSLTTLSLSSLLACSRLGLQRGSGDESRPKPAAAPIALEQPKLRAVQASAPGAGNYRIVLDQPALTRLREVARLRTPAFVRAQARADQALSKTAESGYQGFEWADVLATQALLWHATADARYAEGALRYLNALLDDRFAVGDGKGGADVVRHDSGYGIRTFGAYTALAYDWLRQAPGMNDELRRRMLERLEHWLAWYQKEGYLRDRATSNYYWGYLTTLSFAGLAAAGEAPAADAWLASAQRELSTRVLPDFKEKLPGGGWPEGWQYGEYTTLEIALVARAFQTGAGVDIARKLPWLGQTVTHHVHALLPDEKSVYDGGTWGEHPARPSSLAVTALGLVLEGVDDARGAEARWLAANALPPLKREQAWVALLADRPGAEQRTPRAPGATSLHMPGQGLTFVRSAWSPEAVWASFQAGPRLAEDHQHADQGHFELFRGSDGLVVDGGGSEGSATINHNTLLIDDRGKHLNYPPNQGVWGAKVKTTHFADDGQVLVAVGEIGEAYAPKCRSQGCTRGSVERITRSLVFVRPSLLVIDDDVLLSDGDYDVTWAAHLTVEPSHAGDSSSAVVGQSRVDIRTLLPVAAARRAPREPTPSGEGSHRLNQPWGPMWRLEVASPKGEKQRRFLHFLGASAAAAAPPVTRRVGDGALRGGVTRVEQQSVAVVFADPEREARADLGDKVDTLVVAGLTPGRRYEVRTEDPNCKLRVAPSAGANGVAASSGGFLRLSSPCAGK
jgi:hypothetical protein